VIKSLAEVAGTSKIMQELITRLKNLGESQVTMEELQKSIDSLEAWMRVPFLLHFRGFKYEEIAEELGLPIGTVKSRIFSARQKLQEQVKTIYLTHELTDILN
jgi:RNA polymerase sigma-70 factor (ECF subfamily)